MSSLRAASQFYSSLFLWCIMQYWNAIDSCWMSSSCDKIININILKQFVKSMEFCRDFQVLGHLDKCEDHYFCFSDLMSVSHFRAEGSSKIQARMEQQPSRPPQPSQPPPPPPPMPFRAPTKPPVGPKTSPLKDNPSPEPQLDDIKRGREHFLEPW